MLMTSLWAIIGSVINIKTYFVASVRHRHRCSIILFIFVDFFGTNIEHEPKEDSILELNSTIIGFVYTSYYMWGCKQNGVRLSDSRRLFCLKRNWTKLPFGSRKMTSFAVFTAIFVISGTFSTQWILFTSF